MVRHLSPPDLGGGARYVLGRFGCFKLQAERAAEALETAKQKALQRSNAYDSLVKSNVQVVKVSNEGRGSLVFRAVLPCAVCTAAHL